MSYLILYVPVCLVILMVLEGCRTDDMRRILKRSFSNFGVLTSVLMVGSALIYVIHRFL